MTPSSENWKHGKLSLGDKHTLTHRRDGEKGINMEYVNYLREQQRQKEDELDMYLEATFVEETEEEFNARMKAKGITVVNGVGVIPPKCKAVEK